MRGRTICVKSTNRIYRKPTNNTHVDLGSGNCVVDEGWFAAPDVLEEFVAVLVPLDFVQLNIVHRMVAPQHHGLAQFGVSRDDGGQLEQVFAICKQKNERFQMDDKPSRRFRQNAWNKEKTSLNEQAISRTKTLLDFSSNQYITITARDLKGKRL